MCSKNGSKGNEAWRKDDEIFETTDNSKSSGANF